ncbi:MAG: LysR family transcriptional regulator, partial [Spirochaetaceae bacterium]|nr:LysR family transcriptional regulator [Spirochaetaceae bacterium]
MTIRDAECILSVAKHKSISKAAEEVCVTHQALSKTVERLEHELGARLFSRSSSGVEITGIGLRLIPVFGSLVSEYQKHISIINEIISKDKPKIKITFASHFLLALIPAEITAVFREFEIETDIVHTIEKCLECTRTGEADLAFCHELDYFKELKDLQYKPVIEEPVYAMMHKDNPLSSKKELAFSDLKGVPILNASINSSTASQALISAYINEGFYPDFVLASNNINMLLDNVRSNTGVLVFSPRFVPAGSGDIV